MTLLWMRKLLIVLLGLDTGILVSLKRKSQIRYGAFYFSEIQSQSLKVDKLYCFRWKIRGLHKMSQSRTSIFDQII